MAIRNMPIVVVLILRSLHHGTLGNMQMVHNKTKRKGLVIFAVGLVLLTVVANMLIPGHPISCIAMGGRWGAYGFGMPQCNERTKDAGTVCYSSLECESICVTDLDLPSGTPTSGVCYDWTIHVGYVIQVENGKARPTFGD